MTRVPLKWTPATGALIGISIVAYLLMTSPQGYSFVTRWLFISGPVSGLPEIQSGQLWRLVTPIFLHFGMIHIAFNCLWVWQLGGLIEYRRGLPIYGALVLSAAVLSNLAQFAWTKSPAFGGLSGVVYALFGYVWMKSRYDPRSGLYLSRQTAGIMVGWLFLCMTPIMPNVANAAHVAGIIVGIAAGLVGRALRR